MIALTAIAALTAPGLANDARTTALAGTILPGPGAGAYYNPAYDALTGFRGGRTGVALPVGIIPLLINPIYDPQSPQFDFLATLNQAANLNAWELLPPQGPSEVVIDIDASGIRISSDDLERLLPPTGADGIYRTGLSIPLPGFSFGVAGLVTIGLGAYARADFGATLDTELLTDLAAGALPPNTTYDQTRVLGQAQAGVEFNFGVASAIPLPAEAGIGLYAGGRVRGFTGFLYLEEQLALVIESNCDPNCNDDPPSVAPTGTLYRMYPGEGVGFGFSSDLGIALSYAEFVFGFGVKDVYNRTFWPVTVEEQTLDSSGNFQSVIVGATTRTAAVGPTFTINAAYQLADLGAGFGLTTLGVSAQFGAIGFRAGLGAETHLGPVALRAGIAHDGVQLQFAGGAGFGTDTFGVDVAIATHTTTFSSQRGLQLVASLALGF
jgi:hypothetical protein